MKITEAHAQAVIDAINDTERQAEDLPPEAAADLLKQADLLADVLKLVQIDLGILCSDCMEHRTEDSLEWRMDVMRCPAQPEYCLDCCGCPGH